MLKVSVVKLVCTTDSTVIIYCKVFFMGIFEKYDYAEYLQHVFETVAGSLTVFFFLIMLKMTVYYMFQLF